MSKILGGLDIGGTKCAVLLGKEHNDSLEIIERISFPTPQGPQMTIHNLLETLDNLQSKYDLKVDAIGVSVGGPLNSRKGLILSPPNLPGWENIDIISPLEDRFGVPAAIQNDANACALAEWKWGAGRGLQNVIFLTFGTGMGAGLILDGRIYSGTSDMAGEVGHLRLEKNGPLGFGKYGSFEGFCSGGGIARFAEKKIQSAKKIGVPSVLYDEVEITAKTVAEAANNSDVLALQIYQQVGYRLGQGISLLIDILNPEMIIIGSIFQRQEALLRPYMMSVIKKESLDYASEVCQIVSSALADQVGDYAALSVATLASERNI